MLQNVRKCYRMLSMCEAACPPGSFQQGKAMTPMRLAIDSDGFGEVGLSRPPNMLHKAVP